MLSLAMTICGLLEDIMKLSMSLIMKYRSTSDQNMVLQMWWRWSLVCSSVAGNQLATTLSMHHIINPLLGHLTSHPIHTHSVKPAVTSNSLPPTQCI